MKEVLNYFDQYLVLSTEAKELILSTIDFIKVRRGTHLITVGNINNYMYLIKKGVVRGYYFKEYNEITISLWMENEIFGDVTTYITRNSAIKSYQASEDLELYRINIVNFRALFDVSPEICKLGRIMAEKFIVKTEYLKNCLRDLTAEEKYQLFLIIRPSLINRVKLKQIASYIDIAPETLSRLRHRDLENQKKNNLKISQ